MFTRRLHFFTRCLECFHKRSTVCLQGVHNVFRRCLVTANSFRGQDIAERIHGLREGKEDQNGGGCL